MTQRPNDEWTLFPYSILQYSNTPVFNISVSSLDRRRGSRSCENPGLRSKAFALAAASPIVKPSPLKRRRTNSLFMQQPVPPALSDRKRPTRRSPLRSARLKKSLCETLGIKVVEKAVQSGHVEEKRQPGSVGEKACVIGDQGCTLPTSPPSHPQCNSQEAARR